MGFLSIPQSWIATKKAGIVSLFQRIKDNFDWLYAQIGPTVGGTQPNPSFEVDGDSDDKPDTWDINLYSGGVSGLSPSEVIGTDDLNYTCKADHTSAAANKPITGGSWATCWTQKGSSGLAWISGKDYKSSVIHGGRSLYFIHPGGAGNGGGYAESDYVAVSDVGGQYFLGFTHYASAAGMHDKVEIKWYDKDKAYISTSTVYDSTSNPTSATRFNNNVSPPANARFRKLVLTGGHSDTNQAGVAYFDDISWGRVDDGSISQAKLKTAQQELNGSGNQNFTNVGQYGFYPQIKQSGGTYITVQIANSYNGTTYATIIYVSTDGTGYVRSRFVDSSGEIFWLFILRDKTTKQVLARWCAPDHPCFGNGGDPDMLPHPFVDYDPSLHEVVVIQGPQDGAGNYPSWVTEIRSRAKAQGKSFLEVVTEEYEVDEASRPQWDARPITVGLDSDDDILPGKKANIIKRPVPQRPELLHRALKLRAV